MAETSDGWNVDFEIIPGSHRIRGVVQSISRRICFLPPSEGYPSEYPKHPERLGGQVVSATEVPGQVGGVDIIDYRAAANLHVN